MRKIKNEKSRNREDFIFWPEARRKYESLEGFPIKIKKTWQLCEIFIFTIEKEKYTFFTIVKISVPTNFVRFQTKHTLEICQKVMSLVVRKAGSRC